MPAHVRVSRIAQIPDAMRLERCLRLPELGPRILFFSGGTALRDISSRLKSYTHNSVHLITPFDSGGSSAKLREAFNMLAVGDLRNRLMALADASVKGNPDIYKLFSYRLSEEGVADALGQELDAMVAGQHPLVNSIEEPMRQLIRTHLRNFYERMPEAFDLRGASIGNLILAGGYLANEGDIQSVIFLFSKLVEVRGIVRPIVEDNYHLAAETSKGRAIMGQHRITRPRHETGGIEKLYLVDSQESAQPVDTVITSEVERLLTSADLICYPIGSFYTSLVANLLPRGVGAAIAKARCLKVYVPNVGSDPEQKDMSLGDSVEAIVRNVRKDVGDAVPVDRIMDLVLIDEHAGCSERDRERIRGMGIETVSLPLTAESNRSIHDPTRVVEALLSLA